MTTVRGPWWSWSMDSWLKRLLTVLAGVGVGTLGVLVPATAPLALPAAAGLLGWAVPHPADKTQAPPAKN